MKNSIKIGVSIITLLFILMMFYNMLPYFEFKYARYFLSTKSDKILQNPIFNISFYIHIVSAWLVIAAGLFQFNGYFIKNKPKTHRQIGKFYIIILLFFAAPSGLIIGCFANGGLVSKVGFVLQSSIWWTFTFFAYLEIKKGNVQKHLEYMIKSYAITLAALSLRSESYIMANLFDTKPIETYITVVWLSWVGNLLIAELIIYFNVYSPDLYKKTIA